MPRITFFSCTILSAWQAQDSHAHHTPGFVIPSFTLPEHNGKFKGAGLILVQHHLEQLVHWRQITSHSSNITLPSPFTLSVCLFKLQALQSCNSVQNSFSAVLVPQDITAMRIKPSSSRLGHDSGTFLHQVEGYCRSPPSLRTNEVAMKGWNFPPVSLAC